MKRLFLTLLSVPGLAAPMAMAAAPAPLPERKLHIQHIGSRDMRAERGLGASTKPPAVQRLLLDLAAESQTITSVDAALAGSGVARVDLDRLGLIRCADGRCWLNFGLITAADGRTIRDLSQHYATSLADALLARRATFERLFASYDVPGVDPKTVGFIALGCVALDWDGLDLTAEKGLRRTELPKPDGNYVPQATESSEVSAKRVYCGSRSETLGGYRVTTFGDNAAPRRAFPDFLWHRPADMNTQLLPVLLRPADGVDGKMVGAQLGAVLPALRERALSAGELAAKTALSPDDTAAWVRLLTELEYLTPGDAGRHRLRVPVFTQRDRPMLLAVRQLGGEILSAWLEKNNAALRRDLAQLSVLKQGVPLEEVFNYVWHEVFGLTNGRLVQAGLFADPYAGDRAYPGSIACVFAPGVLKK